MNISLDFDDTYTRDPDAWNRVIAIMRGQGHKVYCITMRNEAEGEPVRKALEGRVDEIYYTNRFAKQKFMFERGINIHVWIDDSPGWILKDAADAVRSTCKYCNCDTSGWSPNHAYNCPDIPF